MNYKDLINKYFQEEKLTEEEIDYLLDYLKSDKDYIFDALLSEIKKYIKPKITHAQIFFIGIATVILELVLHITESLLSTFIYSCGFIYLGARIVPDLVSTFEMEKIEKKLSNDKKDLISAKDEELDEFILDIGRLLKVISEHPDIDLTEEKEKLYSLGKEYIEGKKQTNSSSEIKALSVNPNYWQLLVDLEMKINAKIPCLEDIKANQAYLDSCYQKEKPQTLTRVKK